MNNILSEFDQKKSEYTSFAESLDSLLKKLLILEGVSIHSINFRLKDRLSLEKKISIKGPYDSLDAITDVVGLRIITHFSDEVDVVAKLIEREFSIDKENSGDKKKLLDPDRFGYLSFHYIISNSEARASLPEYKGYNNLKAEVQIRSILQHAWAEIEHDIGYKPSLGGIPDVIKRPLFRLAGMLELADEEFVSIRKKQENYQKEVNEEISNKPLINLKIDKITLREYLKTSLSVKYICEKIKGVTGFELDSEVIYNGPAIKLLGAIKINYLNELDEKFSIYKEHVSERAISIFNEFQDAFNDGAPLELLVLYLAQIVAYISFPKDGIQKLYDTAGVNLKERSLDNLTFEIRKIIQTFSE